MKKSFVYLGVAKAPGDGFFVKAGKTNHPESRVRKYATHYPGGLSSMHAVEVRSEGAAFAAEAKVLASLRAMKGASPMGGEWFLVTSLALDEAFELLSALGEPFLVPYSRKRKIQNFSS